MPEQLLTWLMKCCTEVSTEVIHIIPLQGLMRKAKVDIDCEKVAQISILANKDCNTSQESKQPIHCIYFLFSRYYVHITLLI